MASYNHQPFEDWLLSDNPLSEEQNLQLKEHLDTCETCCQLSTAWRSVEQQFTQAVQMSPTAGFVERWQGVLAADLDRKFRQQTIITMAIFGLGTMTLFGLLFIFFFPVIQTPLPYLLTSLYRVTLLVASVSNLLSAVSKLLQKFISIAPPFVWVAVVVVLISSISIWLVSIQKLTNIRRVLP
jgi:hypothetical protein